MRQKNHSSDEADPKDKKQKGKIMKETKKQILLEAMGVAIELQASILNAVNRSVSIGEISSEDIKIAKSYASKTLERLNLLSYDNVYSKFILECCELSSDHSVSVEDLFVRFQEWCYDNNLKCASKVVFIRELLCTVPSLDRIGTEIEGIGFY